MKIVRITTLLDFGGQERKYISFTQNPSWLVNDYIFAAIGHGGHAEKKIKERGFEVVIFNQKPNISNLKNIWTLYKWFRKIKPDLVHTAAAEANFHGTIAARLAGVKVVVTEEIGFPTHSNKARAVFRMIYNYCDKVICVSKAVHHFLVEINEIKPEQGVLIYNPVGEPKSIERNLSNEFTMVCVGRLEKVKNQQLLIKAFARLKDKNTKLILVGDGREKENLQKLIADLDLSQRIEITGFSAEPEKYLAKGNLFVLPSLSEGFGIAVVEAMQQGLPCLCSSIGGIPEFIEENKTGWMFNPNNEEELYEKLEVITALPQLELDKIGAQAKAYVLQNFSEKKYVTELETLYQQLQ
jgi:glycosyltransferase involved in cell wall biosynthesis